MSHHTFVVCTMYPVQGSEPGKLGAPRSRLAGQPLCKGKRPLQTVLPGQEKPHLSSMSLSCKDMHRRGNTHLGPSVHDINEVASRVGLSDGLQHLLILQAAGAEARQGLAAPADGGLWGEAAAAWQHQVDCTP